MLSARLAIIFVVLFALAPLHASDERLRVIGIVPFPDADSRELDRRSLDAMPRPGWVNDRMWNELVFRAHDEPWVGESVTRRTRTLTPDQVSNLVVYFVHHEDGPLFTSDAARQSWNRAMRKLLSDMTGTTWSGSVTDGPERPLSDGRLHFRIGSDDEFAASTTAIAFAKTSAYAFQDGTFSKWAYSEIVVNPAYASRLLDDYVHTITHELAHVLGFAHVSDSNNLMYTNYSGVRLDRTTADHMNLAYDVGPGVLYPGFARAMPTPALPLVGVVLLAILMLVSGRRALLGLSVR